MGVGESKRIELQVHDFFTPQPIKGARAYFMRSVLHDWPDEQCRKILGHLKDAMDPGYSKILISDCVSASPFCSLVPLPSESLILTIGSRGRACSVAAYVLRPFHDGSSLLPGAYGAGVV